RRGLEGGRQRERLLQRRETAMPMLLVEPDTLQHFRVEHLRGGEIERPLAGAHRHAFGKARLTRSRPAQNQNMSAHVVLRFALNAGARDWSPGPVAAS